MMPLKFQPWSGFKVLSPMGRERCEDNFFAGDDFLIIAKLNLPRVVCPGAIGHRFLGDLNSKLGYRTALVSKCGGAI